MSQNPLPKFSKPWRSCADQISIWQSRGLAIQDRPGALGFLEHVNYYRLSAYCPPFERMRDEFLIGTTFEHLRAAYEFDQGLRDLVSEALEVIEVDLRTTIAHSFGKAHGPFGHIAPGSYHTSFKHANWVKRLRKTATESDEVFVRLFATKYADFPDLPIWMLTEIISFGSISMMFSHMHKPDQKAVGTRYGVQAYYLVSWVHHLVYVRNICAHHARLWDRIWAIKPQLPTSREWSAPLLPSNNRLFVTLLMLNRMMRVASCVDGFRQTWKARVEETPKDAAKLATQMELHVDHVREGRTEQDLLYEVLLKSGFPLTVPVETLNLHGKTVFSVAGGALLTCFDKALTLEAVRAMGERKPERVVCLDAAFKDNDQLKTNAAQIFKTKGVASFKTV